MNAIEARMVKSGDYH